MSTRVLICALIAGLVLAACTTEVKPYQRDFGAMFASNAVVAERGGPAPA